MSSPVCQCEVFTLQEPWDTPNIPTMWSGVKREQLSWFTCRTDELWTSCPWVDQSGGFLHLTSMCSRGWANKRLEVTPTAYLQSLLRHTQQGWPQLCSCVISLNPVTKGLFAQINSLLIWYLTPAVQKAAEQLPALHDKLTATQTLTPIVGANKAMHMQNGGVEHLYCVCIQSSCRLVDVTATLVDNPARTLHCQDTGLD